MRHIQEIITTWDLHLSFSHQNFLDITFRFKLRQTAKSINL